MHAIQPLKIVKKQPNHLHPLLFQGPPTPASESWQFGQAEEEQRPVIQPKNSRRPKHISYFQEEREEGEDTETEGGSARKRTPAAQRQQSLPPRQKPRQEEDTGSQLDHQHAYDPAFPVPDRGAAAAVAVAAAPQPPAKARSRSQTLSHIDCGSATTTVPALPLLFPEAMATATTSDDSLKRMMLVEPPPSPLLSFPSSPKGHHNQHQTSPHRHSFRLTRHSSESSSLSSISSSSLSRSSPPSDALNTTRAQPPPQLNTSFSETVAPSPETNSPTTLFKPPSLSSPSSSSTLSWSSFSTGLSRTSSPVLSTTQGPQQQQLSQSPTFPFALRQYPPSQNLPPLLINTSLSSPPYTTRFGKPLGLPPSPTIASAVTTNTVVLPDTEENLEMAPSSLSSRTSSMQSSLRSYHRNTPSRDRSKPALTSLSPNGGSSSSSSSSAAATAAAAAAISNCSDGRTRTSSMSSAVSSSAADRLQAARQAQAELYAQLNSQKSGGAQQRMRGSPSMPNLRSSTRAPGPGPGPGPGPKPAVAFAGVPSHVQCGVAVTTPALALPPPPPPPPPPQQQQSPAPAAPAAYGPTTTQTPSSAPPPNHHHHRTPQPGTAASTMAAHHHHKPTTAGSPPPAPSSPGHLRQIAPNLNANGNNNNNNNSFIISADKKKNRNVFKKRSSLSLASSSSSSAPSTPRTATMPVFPYIDAPANPATTSSIGNAIASPGNNSSTNSINKVNNDTAANPSSSLQYPRPLSASSPSPSTSSTSTTTSASTSSSSSSPYSPTQQQQQQQQQPPPPHPRFNSPPPLALAPLVSSPQQSSSSSALKRLGPFSPKPTPSPITPVGPPSALSGPPHPLPSPAGAGTLFSSRSLASVNSNQSYNAAFSSPTIQHHQQQPMTAAPSTRHYLDREIEDKLKLLAVSEVKFDEVIEFGFPIQLASADLLLLGYTPDQIHAANTTTASHNSKQQQPFASSTQLQEDSILEAYDGGSTDSILDGFDSTTSSSSTHIPPTPQSKQQPRYALRPNSQAFVSAVPRDMTLKFTLTPPAMRADEAILYGWQKDISSDDAVNEDHMQEYGILDRTPTVSSAVNTNNNHATPAPSTTNNEENGSSNGVLNVSQMHVVAPGVFAYQDGKPSGVISAGDAKNGAPGSASSSIPLGGFGKDSNTKKIMMKRVFGKLTTKKSKNGANSTMMITSADMAQ